MATRSSRSRATLRVARGQRGRDGGPLVRWASLVGTRPAGHTHGTWRWPDRTRSTLSWRSREITSPAVHAKIHAWASRITVFPIPPALSGSGSLRLGGLLTSTSGTGAISPARPTFRRSSGGLTMCSTLRTPAGFGTSTLLAGTGVQRSFLLPGSRRAGSLARTSRSRRSGVTSTRRTGASTLRVTRRRISPSTTFAGRQAKATRSSGTTSSSTRSTPPRSRAACSTTAAVRDELARLRETGAQDRLHRHRAPAARDDRARARGRRLRHPSGDLEPARALGRVGARRRSRRRARRDRQGGARQRPPPRARPGHRRACRRDSLSPGRTSSSAARRPSSNSRATCGRSTPSTTAATTTSSRIRRPTGRPAPPSPGTESLDTMRATPLHSRRTMFGNVEYGPSLTYRASGR